MGKGKSKGKIFLSIVGAAFGFFNAAGLGMKVWQAALYGASIGGTLWSVTHQPKEASTAGGFDQTQTVTSSESMIPIIYGKRKSGGNQTCKNWYT